MSPLSATGAGLVDSAYRAAWSISRHVPEPVAARTLERAADRVWRQYGPGVVQLETNLARAAPGLGPAQLHQLARRSLRSYFRYWHEAFRMPSWSRDRISSAVVTVNIGPLREIHARGRGSIVALPHMANWDLAGAWSCLNGLPVSAIAERLKPESLFNRFVAYRESLGMEIVPLTGGVDPLRAMLSALERERMVCLLCDRSFGASGIDVDLLGEPARLPGGPAVLSRISKVPVVVVIPSYHGPLLELGLSDPIEPVAGPDGVRIATQQIAREVTDGIRHYPHDWHMMQKVFVADLESRPG